MTYIKDNSYRDIPYCVDTPYNDFYTYSNLKDLALNCSLCKEECIRCRTVGILHSVNGRFFLSDVDVSCSEPLVQVSVVYLKSPPQSTVIPYPVQVFGTLQWKNRPVIFVKILQVMTVSSVIRVKRALSGITSIHLARNIHDAEHQEEYPP